jgi:leucyl aminopeptidase (aminopeptidase T)
MQEELRAFNPSVTLLATSAQPHEIRFRLPFARFLRSELHVRHGHMIGITPALMQSGMLADYHRVASLTFLVKECMEQAEEVRVISESGTDLTVRLDNARYRWVPFHGLYHSAGMWGNLPEGETCTTPYTVDGVISVDLLGDYFCAKYGVLDSRLIVRISDGWVTEVEHELNGLAHELWTYLDGIENGRRVGEFGIGTNEALSHLEGNLLQDEKTPGIHLAFGNPVPEVTGAEWHSRIHVDAISIRCTIEVDGTPIMRNGSFVL